MSTGTPWGLRQSMSVLHTWAALGTGWLLYAIFMTGTASYFRDEISLWMRPELPVRNQPYDPSMAVQKIVTELASRAPGSPQWSIELPQQRAGLPTVRWRAGSGVETAYFDPASEQWLLPRATTGGDFFYRFHYSLHHLPPLWGSWLAGWAAMCMLVAIISGVITHRRIFVDLFTFRPGKGQRSWMDAHNIFSVFGLPFHLMIAYTGLVTLMAMYLPWGMQKTYDSPQQQREFLQEMRLTFPPARASGEPAALASLAPLMQQASNVWAGAHIGRVVVLHPGDASAIVVVVRGDEDRVPFTPTFMRFNGTNGMFAESQQPPGAIARTRGFLYGLHQGRFADTTVRWLYFLMSAMGTAMVGTGLVLWRIKRRAKPPANRFDAVGRWFAERLNVGFIAGIPMAMAAFLLANRVIPGSTTGRGVLEISVFFWVLGLALVHALLRAPNRAWSEQWLVVAMLLLSLPLANAVGVDRQLIDSWRATDTVFLGVQAAVCVLAGLALALVFRCSKQRILAKRMGEK